MKVVNLKFNNCPTEKTPDFLNIIPKPVKANSEEQIFCEKALKILENNSLNNLEEFRQFVGFENIRAMEVVFQWYLQHESCTELRKNEEQIQHIVFVYQEEIACKNKRIF